jgi:S1-C subfamily serine protease
MRFDERNRNRLWRASLFAGALPSVLFTFALCMVAAPAAAFSAAKVYRDAANSVVLIFGFEDNGAGSSGTGSVLTRDGLVLTNHHVIAKADSDRLYSNLVVYFKPNPISGDNQKDLTKPYLVDVVARDKALDLALLRVKNPPADLRPLPVGDSEEVDIGEDVAAIGHPGGGGLWTLTTGTVSSKRRDQSRDIFQTDTAINPGNSGGPLLDEHARLVGVNTFVRRVNEQGLPLEGLNYSLRSSVVLAWVNRQGVRRVGSVSRASAVATAPVLTPAPRSEPAPAPEPAPKEALTPPSEPAPEPPSLAEDDFLAKPAPEPLAKPAPAPLAQPEPPTLASPPPPEPEAREFVAPNGTRMYGVPNLENDLAESLMQVREAYAELTERRDESIEEMEDLFDDYDNF